MNSIEQIEQSIAHYEAQQAKYEQRARESAVMVGRLKEQLGIRKSYKLKKRKKSEATLPEDFEGEVEAGFH